MPRSKKISEQMRAESQEQILYAGLRLFSEQGYFNCRVSDIAKAAGMSQGNVYWYFESKEAILKALLQDLFESLEALLVDAEAYPGTSVEKVEHLIGGYLRFAREKEAFFSLFVSLLGHGEHLS